MSKYDEWLTEDAYRKAVRKGEWRMLLPALALGFALALAITA